MGLLSWGSYYAKHHLKAKTCRKGFFKTNVKLNFFAFLLSSSLLAPMLALGAVELPLGQPTGLSSSRVDEAGNSFSIGRIYRRAPDLKSARADDTLTFYAPDGTAHSATITKAIDTDRGNRLLTAIADGTTIVAVVNADGDFFSSVRVNGDYFQSAIYEGQTVVYDSAAGEIVSNPFLNDQLVPEKLSRSSSEELQVNEVTAAAEIISVGVLVDSASQNAYDVVALVDYFIEVANQSYQDVGVDIVFETVAIGTNTPLLSQSDMSLSLYDISCGSTSCNPFASDNSSVISWRDTNKADLVVQIVRYGTNGGTCGIAWTPGPNGADDFTTYLKDLTYSVNALELPNGTSCPDIVVAHEMGHNFGLGHDRTTGCGTTYLPYACGYKNVSQGFGSVMSYVPSNQYVFGLSNPNVTVDGYPFGVPIGQSGEAFAAQAVANVMSYHEAIYQNLSPTYYTVTANAGSGGSISPTSVSVLEGSTTNFTVTSNSNYSINSVTGCNGSLSGSTYTTGTITGDCSVVASFNAIPALTSGTIISNLSGAQGSDEYFYIDVPANASSLTVQLAVGPGDPEIYVGTSYPPPKTSSAACYSELPAGNNESCTINSPSAGRYYVRVHGYSAYSGATLTATVVAPPGTPSILSITPGDERLSVAFTPGLGSTPTSYTVSCVDQGASRLASKSINAQTDIGTHFDSSAAVTFGERNYQNLAAYHQSAEFQRGGARCATDASMAARRVSSTTLNAVSDRAADCSFTNTTIDSDYSPVDGQVLTIPVVFHVIYKADGTGYISEARVQAQIAVLNEDFAGFSGNGYLTSIQFELVDINYVQNDSWYTDAGANMTSEFKSSLAVDPARYMNIYTNDAGGGGTLGYASLAANGSVGSSSDGIVMIHDTIGGRNNGYGNFDEGRTLVHEVGHYLGLEHTFMPAGSCDLPNDYTHGDLIADTPAQLSPDFGTSSSSSCGAPSAIENFMNYSDDDAMYTFTAEQTNRMICSLMSYRSNAYSVSGGGEAVTATGSSSPISVTGLVNDNSYSCTVTASNADGPSSASSPVVATPRAPTVPRVPTISRTDYGDGEIYLYVTVSDNGGSAITSYAATCTDGSTSFVGTSTTSPITVSGLTNDVSYTCTATATNSVGASTASATTAPIIPEETATGLPIWLLYEATQSR